MQKLRHTSAGQLAQDSTAIWRARKPRHTLLKKKKVCCVRYGQSLSSQAQRLVGKQALSPIMEVKATIYRICHIQVRLAGVKDTLSSCTETKRVARLKSWKQAP